MYKFIHRNLGIQLLALYLLFVGPVLLAALVFDRISAQQLVADVKAADLALARAIAQETNTILDSALLAVSQLAEYPEVIDNDLEAMDALFGILQSVRPDVNLVYRLDERGYMVFHYPIGPGSTVGWDFSFRDYYQGARNTRQPILSKGRISPTTEQPVATAVMPLWSESGQFLGLVATNIKLQSLSDTLTSIVADAHSEGDFQVAIIDSAGQVIGHPDQNAILADMTVQLPEITSAVLSGEAGNQIAKNIDGQERLYSYVPIPSASWGAIVSRSTEVAFATPRATHRGILLTIGIFILVGVLFWMALSNRLIRPLQNLSAFSRTIGRDQGVTIEQRQTLRALAERTDQLGDLSRSLQRMEEAIEARLNELSTLLQTSAAVLSSLDSQIVLNRILEQVERLMGIEMCAIVAYDETSGVFRAQASRGLSSRYTQHLAINPSEPQSVTLRAIRSGQPIQISDTESDPSFSALRPRARSEGYRSILATPLKTQHAPPSALLVYRPDAHIFSTPELTLLTSFANHAAMAIENATLFARSDMRLEEQTRRLEALIQSLHDGLLLEDLQGRVQYANRRIGELVNLPLEELSGANINSLLERLIAQAVDHQQARLVVEKLFSGQDPSRVEIAIQAPSGVRYLRLHAFDVTDAQNMLIGRGQILRDVTQNLEIDRMKSSLVSTVSHELRTPLASIKGYATTLLAEDVEWDKIAQREFLEIISTETDRLSNLVSDLLDISRIEAGNLSVTRQECDLGDLVNRAAQRAHPAPDGRLQLQLPENMPALFVDPQRIESVLRNLIENAAKYGGENSPVHVSASIQKPTPDNPHPASIIICVEDEGPGIPPYEGERIFESFYRVENGLTRSAPGAGLGLAICQGFVRAHGGEIWIEECDKGARIVFSLPMNPNTIIY